MAFDPFIDYTAVAAYALLLYTLGIAVSGVIDSACRIDFHSEERGRKRENKKNKNSRELFAQQSTNYSDYSAKIRCR